MLGKCVRLFDVIQAVGNTTEHSKCKTKLVKKWVQDKITKMKGVSKKVVSVRQLVRAVGTTKRHYPLIIKIYNTRVIILCIITKIAVLLSTNGYVGLCAYFSQQNSISSLPSLVSYINRVFKDMGTIILCY